MLESCVYGDEWPPQQAFRADCLEHASPALACGCGIYAVMTREAALTWARWARSAVPNAIVYGQVHLWGRILCHSEGYRAQRAYPYELELLDDDEWQCAARRTIERELRSRYAVDVVARELTEAV